jgi:hypothetical protein
MPRITDERQEGRGISDERSRGWPPQEGEEMKHQMSVLVGPMNKEFLEQFFPEGTEITAGDTKLMWDSENEDEVETARSTFEKLTKKGYAAFKAEGKDGHAGAQIKKFDPEAERIILIPQMQGGC